MSTENLADDIIESVVKTSFLTESRSFDMRKAYDWMYEIVKDMDDNTQLELMVELAKKTNGLGQMYYLRMTMMALTFRKPSEFFKALDPWQMFNKFHSLWKTMGCKQNDHHSDDVFTHTMKALDACSTVEGANTFDVKLVTLFHDIGKPVVSNYNKSVVSPLNVTVRLPILSTIIPLSTRENITDQNDW